MTIEEFYEEIGSNYSMIVSRFNNNTTLIERFVRMFENDTAFAELKDAISTRNAEAIFLATHTLKGVASNLGFTKMEDACISLMQKIRDNDYSEMDQQFAIIEQEYTKIMEALRRL